MAKVWFRIFRTAVATLLVLLGVACLGALFLWGLSYAARLVTSDFILQRVRVLVAGPNCPLFPWPITVILLIVFLGLLEPQ